MLLLLVLHGCSFSWHGGRVMLCKWGGSGCLCFDESPAPCHMPAGSKSIYFVQSPFHTRRGVGELLAITVVRSRSQSLFAFVPQIESIERKHTERETLQPANLTGNVD